MKGSSDAADIVFSMSASGSSGSGGGEGGPPRKKPATVAVRVTTGGGHPAITPEMAEREARRKEALPRRKTPTGENERSELQAQWQELERQREALETARRTLAEDWPEDVTLPGIPTIPVIPTIPAIDWKSQPPIPAEKIDWSKQGEPLRVRPTFGAMLMALTMILSVLGAGAYFYWGVKMHVTDQSIHLPKDGIPWGVKASFETRKQAATARQALRQDIVGTMKSEHEKLRQDIVKAVQIRYRRRR